MDVLIGDIFKNERRHLNIFIILFLLTRIHDEIKNSHNLILQFLFLFHCDVFCSKESFNHLRTYIHFKGANFILIFFYFVALD